MAYDPFASLNPSDSGLLDSAAPYPGKAGPGKAGSQKKRSEPTAASVPERDEYEAPAPAPIMADTPEETLRETPLPEGFLTRLRALVDEL